MGWKGECNQSFILNIIYPGGILPVFLEIGELPADVDGALNATKDELATVRSD